MNIRITPQRKFSAIDLIILAKKCDRNNAATFWKRIYKKHLHLLKDHTEDYLHQKRNREKRKGEKSRAGTEEAMWGYGNGYVTPVLDEEGVKILQRILNKAELFPKFLLKGTYQSSIAKQLKTSDRIPQKYKNIK